MNIENGIRISRRLRDRTYYLPQNCHYFSRFEKLPEDDSNILFTFHACNSSTGFSINFWLFRQKISCIRLPVIPAQSDDELECPSSSKIAKEVHIKEAWSKHAKRCTRFSPICNCKRDWIRGRAAREHFFLHLIIFAIKILFVLVAVSSTHVHFVRHYLCTPLNKHVRYRLG